MGATNAFQERVRISLWALKLCLKQILGESYQTSTNKSLEKDGQNVRMALINIVHPSEASQYAMAA